MSNKLFGTYCLITDWYKYNHSVYDEARGFLFGFLTSVDGVGNEGVRRILRVTLCLVDDRLTLAQHNWIAGIDFYSLSACKYCTKSTNKS